ncbi:MAG TPA: histidine kinase [Candidatus Limnocylindria bacterium]|nr:histidine kinase [Candidatus Limnocylindria bacterium]
MTSAIDESESTGGKPFPTGRAWRNLVWQIPAFIAGWTAVGIAFGAQHYLKSADLGEPIAWRIALTGALADWYVFALLSIPTCWLANQYPLIGNHWRLRVALHAMASAVFSLLWILVRVGVANWLDPRHTGGRAIGDLLRFALVATFFFNLLVYWVVMTGVHALAYYRSLRERERRVLELEHRLTTARLHALQMELNPHFLFNALNGISTLMYRDVDAADSMLLKLASLLRYALDHSDRHQVRLGEELEFLGRYLDLEQMRFGSRLIVERDIDPASLDALVPNLVLQPLVENAIKHGFEPQTRQGKIRISAKINGQRLILGVEDNGRGLPTGSELREGVGTSNSKARLAQLYGSRAAFRLEKGSAGGVHAIIELPLDLAEKDHS